MGYGHGAWRAEGGKRLPWKDLEIHGELKWEKNVYLGSFCFVSGGLFLYLPR